MVPRACVALAIQALHVAEEFSTGFHIRAPALLGLPAWSAAYFICINMAAIAAWSLATAAVASGRGNAMWSGLIWFLALAAIGNAVWHPAGSLIVGGYFPGTVTALPLGFAGFRLVRGLSARQE